jgi:biotin transport system substrate-specific component
MTKRPTGSATGVRAADIAVIAAFAALIIVLGGVTVPVGGAGVPIVLQNMGVALAGMILGWRRGGLAVLLFLGVGFLGVPNMAGWTPALAAVSGPTVGYIIGYAVVGFLVGALCDLSTRVPRIGGNPALLTVWFAVAGLIGVCVQYLCGSVGLMVRTDMDFGAALVSNGPFIPGDIAKVVVAAVVATAVLRAVPDLRPRRTAAAPSATVTDTDAPKQAV